MRRDLRAVMTALEQEYDDVEDAAKAAIEAYESVNGKRDQWIVVARPMRDGPYVAVGSWTTKNQAMKASRVFVSAHKDDTTGTGLIVMPMYQPEWVEKWEE